MPTPPVIGESELQGEPNSISRYAERLDTLMGELAIAGAKAVGISMRGFLER